MMTIKEQKIHLFFLKSFLEILKAQRVQELSALFENLFSRKELIDILEYLYLDGLGEYNIEDMKDVELLDLIGNDVSILEYYTHVFEEQITKIPELSHTEISEFFERTNNELHYLYSKPIEKWDEYDRSNYYSLLFKSGTTKRVFAIFTSDVDEKDKYVVSTKPSFFFDTQEEAEEELNKILTQEKFKEDDLKIMSLWKIH